jgi:hypothetical protein
MDEAMKGPTFEWVMWAGAILILGGFGVSVVLSVAEVLKWLG